MDFTISKETVTVKESVYCGNAQQTIDCDITLPEYCPDILRILKCQLIPRVCSSTVSGDRLTVEGSALLRILYVDENENCVHSYEQICPFSKTVEIGNICENVYTYLTPQLDYVNSRAVNQRRINISGAISVKIELCALREKEIISCADGGGIQTKMCSARTATVKGYAQKTITVDETLELAHSDYAVARLIRYSGDVSATEVKVITNKLLVKGELTIKMLYTADNGQNNTEIMTHSLPISQIIDVDGLEEDSECDVKLNLMSLDITLRSDSNGELRQADIVAKISADVMSCENIDISTIKEAYSIKCELQSEKKKVDFTSLCENINDTCLSKCSIDVSSVGITEIIDIWANAVEATAFSQGDKLTVKGTVLLSMLVNDLSGKPAYLERQSEFETTYNLRDNNENTLCSAEVKVSELDYSILGNDKIDIRLELKISSAVHSVQSEEIIVKLIADEMLQKNNVPCALTIYFSDENETIWDIAKRYNTTVAAIMEENGLKNEVLDKPQMLMIPSV